MRARRSPSSLSFPPPEYATPEGLLAMGGDASPERLLAAYESGVFPWPHPGYPLLWFSPDPRWVIVPACARAGRSLRKCIRRGAYEVRFDTSFGTVMRACAAAPREGQDGTWITDELLEGYGELHARGFAHSIEAWEDGELAGGLYGVALGRAFFGESMFAARPDASKVAFITLLGHLQAWGFSLVDCQVHTEHTARFGAEPWPRSRFLAAVGDAVAAPDRLGPWMTEMTPAAALARLDAGSGGRGPEVLEEG